MIEGLGVKSNVFDGANALNIEPGSTDGRIVNCSLH